MSRRVFHHLVEAGFYSPILWSPPLPQFNPFQCDAVFSLSIINLLKYLKDLYIAHNPSAFVVEKACYYRCHHVLTNQCSSLICVREGPTSLTSLWSTLSAVCVFLLDNPHNYPGRTLFPFYRFRNLITKGFM